MNEHSIQIDISENKVLKKIAPFELKQFMIIAGKNGVGKTQLLKHLDNSFLSSTQNITKSKEKFFSSIRYLTSDDFNISNSGPNFQITIPAEDPLIIEAFHSTVSKLRKIVSADYSNFDIPESLKNDILKPESLLDKSKWDALNSTNFKSNSDEYNFIYQTMGDIWDSIPYGLFENIYGNIDLLNLELYKKIVLNFLNNNVKPDFKLLKKSISRKNIKGESKSIFQQFINEYENSKKEILRRFEETDEYPIGPKQLLDYFLSVQPSNLLNETLKKLGSPLVFRKFEESEFKSITRGNSAVISTNNVDHLFVTIDDSLPTAFEQLSPGEQMKLQIGLNLAGVSALPQFSQNSGRTLLLLDEVDAHLDPEMSQALVTFVREKLIGELGMWVVITTHSLSTMALAAPKELYTLEKREKQISYGLFVEQTNLKEAANLINRGLDKSVSFGFRDTHQVICESKDDAEVYTEAYRACGFVTDRSIGLQFIGPGLKTKAGSLGSGKSVVRTLVSQCREFGLDTVFGLIDQDANEKDTDSIFVNGLNEWYTLEFAIYDPLAILYTLKIAKGRNPDFQPINGLHLPEVTKLHQLKENELQDIVDHFSRFVFPSSNKKIEREYVNGKKLKIPIEYKNFNKKIDFVTIIEEAFGESIKQLDKHRMKYIAKVFYRHSPGFVPKGMKDVFAKIENASLYI